MSTELQGKLVAPASAITIVTDEIEAVPSGSYSWSRIDAKLLHELVEKLKAIASEARNGCSPYQVVAIHVG